MMNVQSLVRASVGVALASALGGCIVSTTSNPNRNAYEACTGSDNCGSGTICENANTAVAGSTAGSFCTTSCVSSSDCPADPSGNAVSCITVASSSQCYRTCGAGNTCLAGETCGVVMGANGVTVSICVPNGTTTGTCGGVGQSCCASAPPCNSGLACSGGLCQSCGNTGQACCGGNSCAAGLTCGTNGLCGACGQSGQACCAGNTCATGLSCAGGVCGSCGTAGQPCCAGSTCTQPGLACGSDGLCGLAPYTGCSGTSVGAACLGGMNSAGQVIDTTCTIPEIPNPGPTGFCTHICSGMAGSMLECPQWPNAGRSYTYNCYLLQGATDPMCFVDCTGGQPCPADTQCVMFTTSTGAPVQICMPPVA